VRWSSDPERLDSCATKTNIENYLLATFTNTPLSKSVFERAIIKTWYLKYDVHNPWTLVTGWNCLDMHSIRDQWYKLWKKPLVKHIKSWNSWLQMMWKTLMNRKMRRRPITFHYSSNQQHPAQILQFSH
jgi:hypothetical protein